MVLGAPVVQAATAVMLRGFGIVGQMERELRQFMEWHGFTRPADFIGICRTGRPASARCLQIMRFVRIWNRIAANNAAPVSSHAVMRISGDQAGWRQHGHRQEHLCRLLALQSCLSPRAISMQPL